MIFNLTKLMLANTMMIGVIMTICTNNWITMWMGLEISLLSIMPFMQNKSKMSSESMMKYFIVQSIASTMLVISVIYMLIGVNMFNEMILTTSMVIKLGLSPFHNWLLMIIEGIDYICLLSLLTILKLPPLTILHQINSKLLMIPIIISMLLSSISCMNQSSVKKTLGYSSIFNMSLMTTAITKINMMFSFMAIYMMMLTTLVISLMKNKVNFINQIIFNEFSPWIKINLWINMLSLSGFPLTVGFILKLIVVQNLLMNSEMMLLLTVVLTSMLVSMFYMRMAFSSMMNFHIQKKWNMNLLMSPLFLMAINLMMSPLILSLVSIY